MATPLDTGLISSFGIIFPFLLVLVFFYGAFSYTKLFGDNKGLQVILALILAFFVLLSPTLREVVNLMTPWFVLLFLFILFAMVGFKTLGASNEDVHDVFNGPYAVTIVWWIIGMSIVIALGSLSSITFKEGAPTKVNITGTSTGGVDETGSSAFWAILFHPKVLGLIAIFLIALAAVNRLTADSHHEPEDGSGMHH